MPSSLPEAQGTPVWFLLHVPKCAGTTLEAHFAAALGPGFLKAPRWESVLRDVVGNRIALPRARLPGLRVVSGHSLAASMARAFAPREVRECLLLREPVGWFLSFYNYRIGRHRERGERHPGSFADWYRTQPRNPVARFLLGRYFGVGYPAIFGLSSRGQLARLNRELARFHFVGDIAATGRLVAHVSAELGVPGTVRSENVGAVKEATRESIGPAMAARLLAENAVDAALHRLWSGREFGPGAPPGCAAAEAALPPADHLGYLVDDAVSSARRRLSR
jgi:hypothetical protein